MIPREAMGRPPAQPLRAGALAGFVEAVPALRDQTLQPLLTDALYQVSHAAFQHGRLAHRVAELGIRRGA